MAQGVIQRRSITRFRRRSAGSRGPFLRVFCELPPGDLSLGDRMSAGPRLPRRLRARRCAGAPGRQAQVLLPEGGLEMAPTLCRSDEMLEPELHDLGVESQAPTTIRKTGVPSPPRETAGAHKAWTATAPRLYGWTAPEPLPDYFCIRFRAVLSAASRSGSLPPRISAVVQRT